MVLLELVQRVIPWNHTFHNLLVDWGPNSKFPEFRDRLVANATAGFISLALIIGGFVLALAFEKKIGWILAIGGVAYLLHILGLY